MKLVKTIDKKNHQESSFDEDWEILLQALRFMDKPIEEKNNFIYYFPKL